MAMVLRVSMIEIGIVECCARTRERCDEVASQGFLVILPDYYHGQEAQHCTAGDFLCWAGGTNPSCPATTCRHGALHRGELQLDAAGGRLDGGEGVGRGEGGHQVRLSRWVLGSSDVSQAHVGDPT